MKKTQSIEAQSCLSGVQKNQILKQVQYHLTSVPYEYLELNNHLQIKFSILPDVTRPMSSKGLAKWLWKNSEIYYNKNVCDIGSGCGIQGITCKLGGAENVVFSDILCKAVECTKLNIENILPNINGTSVFESDIFDSIDETQKFDLIIFAQPYFPGIPVDNFKFTTGMMDTMNIQKKFFKQAKNHLQINGKILMMSWDFVGTENNPINISKDFGYKLVEVDDYFDWQGVQQGEFSIVLFEI